MTKLPQIKPKEVIKALKRLGFEHRRTSGSHMRFKHPDGRGVTVSFHNRPISKGTLKSILHQAEIALEDLLENI